MTLKIEIQPKKIEGFTEEAQKCLKEVVGNYSNEVIAEAYRIEAGWNGKQNKVEVTGTHVTLAKSNLRMSLPKLKSGGWLKFFKILSSASSLIAGWMFDSTQFTSPSYILTFMVVAGVAFISLTYIVIKE